MSFQNVDVIFTYSFPHKKTHTGLLKIIELGIKPKIIIAAPWKRLKGSKPLQSSTFATNEIHTAKEISDLYNIPYLEADHNSDVVIEALSKIAPDLGIILGARILSGSIIRSFSEGILNMHGGILPENRGLDCQKWAVLLGIPQGTSLHFITEEIDKGRIIDTSIISVEPQDSIDELLEKIQMEEIELLIRFLTQEKQSEFLHPKQPGKYHGKMDETQEKLFMNSFITYKNSYSKIVSAWQNGIDFH